MRYPRALVLTSVGLALGASSAFAQGGMMGRGGMMGGMRGDSTSAAIMSVVHELMTNHDKLRRTVTNLPNGIRTLTESDDPVMAQQIKKHVAATGEFVTKGVDPNLPMSSPALHGVLRNGTKVTRQTELTAKGVLVTETSTDSATVALLQAHAAEVTDLVNRGMAAMREKMMGGGQPPVARDTTPTPPVAHVHTPGMSHDSAMAAMHRASDVPASDVPASAMPTRAGQEAFATIGEIVRLLEADPRTDWSKVDLEALRQHLMDMDDVTMRAAVRTTSIAGGATFDVQGTGRVREAIRRMAVSHGAMITAADGFSWQSVETPTGARVTVRALKNDDTAMAQRLRALGFVALLTLGDHHTAHHLGIASGTMRESHRHSP
jgi:hypothetical protein